MFESAYLLSLLHEKQSRLWKRIGSLVRMWRMIERGECMND